MNRPPPLVLRHRLHNATVQFHWSGDRYDHAVRLGDAEQRTVDEHRDADWPDCPPLQQLSIESIADRDVALGVGCAGTSHWSVSIEPTESGFRFDWACRAKRSPERLGSRYRNAEGFTLVPGEETELRTDERFLRIAPRSPLDDAGTYRWAYAVEFRFAEGG